MIRNFILCSSLFVLIASSGFSQDGTLDNTFATGGIFEYAIPGLEITHATGIVMQNDGKYVVGGKANGPDDPRMLALRLNADGTIDDSYGTDGYSLNNVFQRSFAHTIGIQADQKVLLLGQDYLEDGNIEDFGLLRLNTDGSLDPTFGIGGKDAVDYGLGEEGYKVIQLPDERLMVAGFTTWDVASQSSEVVKNNLCVGRLLANGTKDSTFGTNGVFTLDMGNRNDYGVAMIMNPEGKAISAGFSNGSGYVYSVMYQLDTLGVLDPSFGTDGIVTSPIDYSSSWTCIKQHSDTKLVCGGQVKTVPGSYDMLVERFTSNGIHDSSFATNGILKLDLGGVDEIVEDLEIQPNGKILLLGYSGDENVTKAIVIRLNSDGTLDNSFGTGGIFGLYISDYQNKVKEIILQPDGLIVVAGFTINPGGDDLFVFRLLNDDVSAVPSVEVNNFSFEVFPNPADKYITCSYQMASNDEVSFELTNNLHQHITSWQAEFSNAGSHQKQIELPAGLPAGIYYLHLETHSSSAVQPVVVK